MNPLIKFDSPRAFENAGGSTIKSSPTAKLSADLLAERVPANPLPGEVSFLRLSINQDGPLSQQVQALLDGYVPLSQVNVDPVADTIPRRSNDGTVYFQYVTIKDTNGEHGSLFYYQPGDALKLSSPANIEVSAVGAILFDLGTKPSLSASDPNLAQSILTALGALGLVEVTP